MSKEQSKLKPVCRLNYYVSLKLKLCFAEMMDLVDLTCFAVDPMRWDNFPITYVD